MNYGAGRSGICVYGCVGGVRPRRVGGGVHFCTFLLVKLMGAVVSRQGPWNDVKLSVTGPNHSV